MQYKSFLFFRDTFPILFNGKGSIYLFIYYIPYIKKDIIKRVDRVEREKSRALTLNK